MNVYEMLAYLSKSPLHQARRKCWDPHVTPISLANNKIIRDDDSSVPVSEYLEELDRTDDWEPVLQIVDFLAAVKAVLDGKGKVQAYNKRYCDWIRYIPDDACLSLPETIDSLQQGPAWEIQPVDTDDSDD